MKSYTIKATKGGPDFSVADTLTMHECFGYKMKSLLEPDEITAGAKICHDDQAIYVQCFAKEAQIRAEEKNPLGSSCEDSCLEFFIAPMAEHGNLHYFNFEYSASGCYFVGFASGRDDIIRLLPDCEEDLFTAEVTYVEGGWKVEYKITYEFIKRFFPEFDPKPGTKVRANCYKCGDKTPKPHFLSWNDMTNARGTFHYAPDFGEMIFE